MELPASEIWSLCQQVVGSLQWQALVLAALTWQAPVCSEGIRCYCGAVCYPGYVATAGARSTSGTFAEGAEEVPMQEPVMRSRTMPFNTHAGSEKCCAPEAREDRVWSANPLQTAEELMADVSATLEMAHENEERVKEQPQIQEVPPAELLASEMEYENEEMVKEQPQTLETLLDQDETMDLDLGGVGNNVQLDLDDDGDGHPDHEEVFPMHSAEWKDDSPQVAAGYRDLFGDGIEDNYDQDDDGDGFVDRQDMFALNFMQHVELPEGPATPETVHGNEELVQEQPQILEEPPDELPAQEMTHENEELVKEQPQTLETLQGQDEGARVLVHLAVVEPKVPEDPVVLGSLKMKKVHRKARHLQKDGLDFPVNTVVLGKRKIQVQQRQVVFVPDKHISLCHVILFLIWIGVASSGIGALVLSIYASFSR